MSPPKTKSRALVVNIRSDGNYAHLSIRHMDATHMGPDGANWTSLYPYEHPAARFAATAQGSPLSSSQAPTWYAWRAGIDANHGEVVDLLEMEVDKQVRACKATAKAIEDAGRAIPGFDAWQNPAFVVKAAADHLKVDRIVVEGGQFGRCCGSVDRACRDLLVIAKRALESTARGMAAA